MKLTNKQKAEIRETVALAILNLCERICDHPLENAPDDDNEETLTAAIKYAEAHTWKMLGTAYDRAEREKKAYADRYLSKDGK